MKIIDKINRVLEEDERFNMSPKKQSEDQLSPKQRKIPKTWYSYEYFPPKTTAGT